MKAKRNLIQFCLLWATLLVVPVVKAQPVITQQPTNQTAIAGSNTTLSVSVSGAGPFTYQWLCNGTNLPYSPIITTVAGNGIYGYSGDGGAATNAELNYPASVAVDSGDNFYVADVRNNRIRKVGTNGVITTVAGNGTVSYSGDGGAATNATLTDPYGVTVDSGGNLYIADYGNNRIRKVGTNGIITTVAGNGTNGYSGDGGAATNATLSDPYGVTVDSGGNLYIADYFNNRIRKVGTNGIITTVAGNGIDGYSGDGGAATNAALSNPDCVTVDSGGNLYIVDNFHNVIRKVGTNGVITTVAGNGSYGYSGDGGAATNAKLNDPTGVTVDSGGNLYISDYENNRVRKVGTNGIITTVAGNGTQGYSGDGGAASHAQLYHPTSVTVDSGGNLYIADYENNRVRKVGTNGVITTVAGNGTQGYSGDGSMATDAQLNYPADVSVDSISNLYIADYGNNRVRKVGANGVITTVAGNGTNGYSGDGGAATNATLSDPYGVTVDSGGNLYIADYGNNRIRKVGTNGVITTVAGNGSYGYSGDGGAATNANLSNPDSLTVDSVGYLYIADTYNNRVRKVGMNGVITTMAGNGTGGYSGDGSASTSAELASPAGVAVDGGGNLYIADYGNNRIRKVGTNGVITTVAGNGIDGYSGDGGAATNAKMNCPAGLTVDSAGNLFITDVINNRIRKVGTNGVITTVAGNGTQGYSGDGDAATNATLSSPEGVTVDNSGNLYIADSGNNRIRKMWNNGSPIPSLTLNNVAIQSSGNYQVIVTGNGGSITSNVASLLVLPCLPPQGFTGASTNKNQLKLQFSGTANYPYILQSATNLTTPINWQSIVTNPADVNGNWQFMNTNLNGGQKFYRAVGQ